MLKTAKIATIRICIHINMYKSTLLSQGTHQSALAGLCSYPMNYFSQVSGQVRYNGQDLDGFYVHRTSAYISQTDNHIGELTVRETLDFAARCQGAGSNFAGFFTLPT